MGKFLYTPPLVYEDVPYKHSKVYALTHHLLPAQRQDILHDASHCSPTSKRADRSQVILGAWPHLQSQRIGTCQVRRWRWPCWRILQSQSLPNEDKKLTTPPFARSIAEKKYALRNDDKARKKGSYVKSMKCVEWLSWNRLGKVSRA